MESRHFHFFLISTELKLGLRTEKGVKHQGSRGKGVGGEMELRGIFLMRKTPACFHADDKHTFGRTGVEASGGALLV